MHPATLARLMTQDIGIAAYRAGARDDYNHPLRTFDEPVSVKGYLERQKIADDEINRNRETAVSRWTLFLPIDTAVTHRDRVIHDGKTFEVDGTVNKLWDPHGRRYGHLEAQLRLVENAREEGS